MTNSYQQSKQIMSIGDPPKSSLVFKFREPDKTKWIVKKNFIV